MSAEQCAEVMLHVATEAQYGDENLIETLLVGTREEPAVSVREVSLEALYPAAGPRGGDNQFMDEEVNFQKHLQENGMREPYVPASAKK